MCFRKCLACFVIFKTVFGTRQGTARRRSLAGMGETKILTTHFQEHVFPDIPCMTCRKRQGTEHSKTAELGMDGLEGMSGTVLLGETSLLLSKLWRKTFLGVSLEAQTKENSLNRLESTNKETHGPSVVICCFSNGLLISICKCPRTRCIQIVDKYKYEPTSWPRNQEHRAASSE